jgi:bla regulator protein blaR1
MTIRSLSATGLIFLASFKVFAQPAPALPTFEAASVKPSKPDARGSSFNFTPGGGLTITNGTLKGIIETAYDVRDFQISGASGWMDSEHYDIFAKSAFDDSRAQTGNSQERIKETRLRLQTLLAQRFQLRIHRETKELPVYALALGKKGSKLAEAGNDPENPRSGIQAGCGQMTGMRASIANLTMTLSRQLGSPVLDRTGLPGKYDFHLQWTPDAGSCSPQPDGPAVSPDGPSIFTAIQEQLGLKLESTKAAVEIIVIDHVEKASAN